jgi:GDP-L-fucose synthase
VFASRQDGDLADAGAVERLFKRVQPTHVLHLAARLASLHEMTARPVDFWLANTAINNNVLSAAHAGRAWGGHPVRVISVLSTVMFPRDATFPVGADQAEAGTLHPAGEAYALAKRGLAALSRWYNAQHGESFLTVLPGNFFGAHGDFGAATAPLANALLAKAIAAADAGAAAGAPPPALRVMGTGKPLRQLMHASDLARILLWALEHYAPPAPAAPLVVAGPEHSIRDIAEMAAAAAGFTGALAFDTDAVDGPLRRTADAAAFQALAPDFAFTPLADSMRETAAWLRANNAATTAAATH